MGEKMIYCEHQKPRGHCPMCGQQATPRYLLYKDDAGFLVNAERGILGFSRTTSGDKADALIFQSIDTAKEAKEFLDQNEEGFKIYDWNFQPNKTIQFEYIIRFSNLALCSWINQDFFQGGNHWGNCYSFTPDENAALRFPSWQKAKEVAEKFDGAVIAVNAK